MTTALRHNITKTINDGKHTLTARISLDDDCNNGHQDFHLTGEIYEAGKPRIDRYMVTYGAIGDTVAEHCPELAIFNRLHLCDYAGVPMHAVSNMYFHLHNKLNQGHAVDSEEHKTQYCEYYRILPTEFEALRMAENEIQFAMIFRDLPIVSRWKAEAETAIALLEQLTGKKFENNSTRSQLRLPSDAVIQAELDKITSGYYSEESRQARKEAKRQAQRAHIVAEADKKKAKIDLELAVKLAIFDCGVPDAKDNAIFYSHTNKVKLNWRNYGQPLSEAEVAKVRELCKLPDGVTFE